MKAYTVDVRAKMLPGFGLSLWVLTMFVRAGILSPDTAMMLAERWGKRRVRYRTGRDRRWRGVW